ncbi:MAG: hypothetical protein NDI94_04265, partial [Candidatus Woesearchaeota archaeon]|nr:hypothetical protein [Candidatus Woesearchaeota archaeon]
MADRLNAWKWMIVFVILSAMLFSVQADPGGFCYTSPCSCGLACQDGGNESANGYNTFDSCRDGTVDTYEYVHDIFLTSL